MKLLNFVKRHWHLLLLCFIIWIFLSALLLEKYSIYSCIKKWDEQDFCESFAGFWYTVIYILSLPLLLVHLACSYNRAKKTVLTVFLIFLDILTKYWVNISDPEFSVIGNLLRITHVKNTGVAFGTPLPGIAFLIPVILLGMSIFLWKSWNKISEIEKTGYLVIITGGLLNALERMFLGSVTDFISVQYFSVFNIADVAITGWVIVLFWDFLFGNRKS